MKHSAPLFAFVGLLLLLSACEENPFAAKSWPPQPGHAFPEIAWLDHQGRPVSLADFRGKVLVVEPVGMECKACIALSDRRGTGQFQGVPKQADMPPMDDLLRDFAGGLRFNHPDLVHVQLILYDLTNQRPEVEDAALWARHFGFDRDPNVVVLVPKADPRSKKTFRTIPGFWLVDREGRVVRDSTGHRPRHDPYRNALPQLEQMVRYGPGLS